MENPYCLALIRRIDGSVYGRVYAAYGGIDPQLALDRAKAESIAHQMCFFPNARYAMMIANKWASSENEKR